MYYPCSENKGADQLRVYRQADLRLCFRICKKTVFSQRGSFIVQSKENKIIDLFELEEVYSLVNTVKVLSGRAVNPIVTNELSHPYHLDESTFILGELGIIFHFYTNFGEIPVSSEYRP